MGSVIASITSTFVYGPEHQRTRQTRSDGTTIIYAGAQEVETKTGVGTTVKTYWPYGVGVEIDRPTTGLEMNWVHVDRLGSPVAISDASGNLKEKLAYDAWGKRRTIDGAPISLGGNLSATPGSIDGVTDNRGFTGHEMLDTLDLVHMNGRVYDPFLAHFLSADPLVQDPTNGQSYNRYSYVLNNPTNLTDPTGFARSCEASTGSNIPTCAGNDDLLVTRSDGSQNILRGNGSGITVEKIVAEKLNSAGVEKIDPKLSTTAMAGKFVDIASNLKNYSSETQTHVLTVLSGYADTLARFPNTAGSAESKTADAAVRYGADAARALGLIGDRDKFPAEFRSGAIIGAAFQVAGTGPRVVKRSTGSEVVSEKILPEQSTRVGRWMSREEYALMKDSGRVQEGAGGSTSVAISGPASFSKQAQSGSVYVEFTVPSNSILPGGQADWFRLVGPNAPNSSQRLLQRQGGEQLPRVDRLSDIQAVKP